MQEERTAPPKRLPAPETAGDANIYYFFPMRLTREQEAILSSDGDIVINAVAGSGKTTVLVEYAKRRGASSRILYLAFNRSVRMDARKRFERLNMTNVDVQTAHSLAFRRVAAPCGYTVSHGYRIHDIVGLLNIRPVERDPHSPFVIANHILKFASLFCNSTTARVNELDYGATVANAAAAAAARRFHDRIEQGTRLFLAKMDRKEIAATHDFYLKKFQLSRPSLRYDTILFDEGQDASPVMLDVFLSQKAVKVVVGDVHQQIYGWRHAVNALKRAKFPAYPLTTSFRFNDRIAALAMECLGWKRLLGETDTVRILGAGANTKIKTRATIARTNLALIKQAIDAVVRDGAIRKIYFEGNLSSYIYAADGASIYDVLNLYLNNHSRIKDPLIGSMRSFSELAQYAEHSEDMELGTIIEIVKEYGGELPRLLKKLASMHLEDGQREKADMIFSTLHRCKGMEYDSVTLTDDFINEERIKKLLTKEGEHHAGRAKLSEEINLAYVAVTRSRNFLDFPACMFPTADKSLFSRKKSKPARQLPGRFDSSLRRGGRYQTTASWTREMDRELKNSYLDGMPVKTLAERFGRNTGAITARLRKLSLFP